MNPRDQARLARIIAALDASLAAFRCSKTRAVVGDIEVERTLTALRGELHDIQRSEEKAVAKTSDVARFRG
jgi:hypothetical protein